MSLCRNAHLPQYDRNNKYQWQCTLHLGKVHMESDPGHVCSHNHTKPAEKRGCSLNHNDTTQGPRDGMRKQRTMLCKLCLGLSTTWLNTGCSVYMYFVTDQYPLEAFPLPPNISILYIRVLHYGEVSLCSVCAEKN